jgi:hypothetical protein
VIAVQKHDPVLSAIDRDGVATDLGLTDHLAFRILGDPAGKRADIRIHVHASTF